MKLLATHITESLKRSIIDTLLERSDYLINEMIDKIEFDWNQDDKNLRPFSEWNRKLTRLILTHDLVKAFSTWTVSSDELVDFSIQGSVKGSIVIMATIKRDGQIWPLQTSVIYAGGHNIQRLHYRYITTTQLPKLNQTSELKPYIDAIKRLQKGERLQKDIDMYMRQINDQTKKIEEKSSMTDQQIIDLKSFKFPKHQLINRDSHNWTVYSNDRQGYDAMVKTSQDEDVANFKRSIDIDKKRILDIQGQIRKIETKIKQL